MGADWSLCALGGEGSYFSTAMSSWTLPWLWVFALPSENIPRGPTQPVCRNLRACIPDVSSIRLCHVAQYPSPCPCSSLHRSLF